MMPVQPRSSLHTPASPRFQSNSQWALNTFDIVNPGTPPTAHNKVIYAANIGFRVLASRGMNEIMETLRRDVLGWLFWFYTTPLIQRAIVALAPAKVRRTLLTETRMPKTSFLAQLNWRLNPMARWHLTSSNQIMDYLTKPRFAKQTKFLNQLRIWRAGASAVGLVTAILALGIGINLINIAMTRKSIQERNGQGG